MSKEVKVPEMGESITEATVADWHYSTGDSFDSGDILVELETDKVTMEVPAPSAGSLKEIKKQSGETVTLGEVLAIIEEGEAPASSGSDSGSSESSNGKSEQSSPAAQGESKAESKNVELGPGARRLAEEEGVDTSKIDGSGKRGQVTKSDIVNHLDKKSTDSGSSGPAEKEIEPVTPKKQRSGEREEVEPMSRLRQKIAERLVDAQQTAAILTTFNEVDMSGMLNMRSEYKDRFEKAHGVKLGFMSFFVKAAIEALKAYPAINAEIRDNSIVYKNYYDIGVAVGGPKGLVVPVVRDADLLSFAEIEIEIARLAQKVQKGTISLEEMTGGTFTISNGGIYGSMLSTPILNPPQSGILGMHNIVKRPVVVNDEIVIRPVMYLALSYDHRIVDGKEAVSFLVKVKENIENPERMLLEV